MAEEIDIENPGADEAALKEALVNIIQPEVKIESGTITDPITNLDIALPVGYVKFYLQLISWHSPDQELALVGLFSQDGGTTWLQDYDGEWTSHRIRKIGNNVTTVSGNSQDSAGMDLNNTSSSPEVVRHFEMSIFPGSDTELAMIRSEDITSKLTADGVSIRHCVCTINTARVDKLRLMPFASDGLPTVLSTIDKGSWLLTGVPSP